MPNPVCVLCNKPIKPPVFNTPFGSLCVNCYRELDNALNEFASDYLYAKIYGKPIPNVDEYVEKYYERFKKLIPNKKVLRLQMMIRILDYERRLYKA